VSEGTWFQIFTFELTVPFHSIRQSRVTADFFYPGFNLFQIFPIFWNFSKWQKSHVSAELIEIVQYVELEDPFQSNAYGKA